MKKLFLFLFWLIISASLYGEEGLQTLIDKYSEAKDVKSRVSLALLYDSAFQIEKSTAIFIQLANELKDPYYYYEAGRHCFELGLYEKAREYLSSLVLKSTVYETKAKEILSILKDNHTQFTYGSQIDLNRIFEEESSIEDDSITIQIGIYSIKSNAVVTMEKARERTIPAFIERYNGFYRVLFNTSHQNWDSYLDILINHGMEYIIID